MSADALEFALLSSEAKYYPMNGDGEDPEPDPSPSPDVISEDDANFLVKIIEFFIELIKSFGEWLVEQFNDTDDDYARDEIHGMKCHDIEAKSDAHWIVQFGYMISGPTGDDDELAMLKVLKCLSAERVKNIVHHFGLEDFMGEFQGDEWDALVIRLRECGLLSFADWDDDASRRYITKSSKSALAKLSIPDIVQLCYNMFSGSCGDDDENAIIRLISSQDICKIKLIVKAPYISIDQFDDNVDGEEWDTLSAILGKAYFFPSC